MHDDDSFNVCLHFGLDCIYKEIVFVGLWKNLLDLWLHFLRETLKYIFRFYFFILRQRWLSCQDIFFNSKNTFPSKFFLSEQTIKIKTSCFFLLPHSFIFLFVSQFPVYDMCNYSGRVHSKLLGLFFCINFFFLHPHFMIWQLGKASDKNWSIVQHWDY
jgi:hypothetical protein